MPIKKNDDDVGVKDFPLPYQTIGKDLDRLASLFGVCRKPGENDAQLRARVEASMGIRSANKNGLEKACDIARIRNDGSKK